MAGCGGNRTLSIDPARLTGTCAGLVDSDWLVDGIGAGMRGQLLSRIPSPTSVIDSKERQYGSAFDCETALNINLRIVVLDETPTHILPNI